MRLRWRVLRVARATFGTFLEYSLLIYTEQRSSPILNDDEDSQNIVRGESLPRNDSINDLGIVASYA